MVSHHVNKHFMLSGNLLKLTLLQALRCYGNEWIVEIKDITDFVREQHKHVKSNQLDKLMVAKEQVYPVTDMEIAAQIGVESS